MISYIAELPKIILVIAFALLLTAVKGLPAQDNSTNSSGFSAAPEDFQPLSKDSGWLLGAGRLYWTDDAGATWQNRTPADIGDRSLIAADFLDPARSLITVAGLTGSGEPTLQVARSDDGGASWTWANEAFLEGSGEIFLPGSAHLQFLDDQHAWLVVGRQSSSNFNTGDLFSTTDGGATWTRRQAVSGSPVHFISAARGWMLAGPEDEEIHQSENGGQSWQKMKLPDLDPEERHRFYLPSFSKGGLGTIPVLLPSGKGTLLRYYYSDNSGRTWYRGPETAYDVEYGQTLPIALAQGQPLLAAANNDFNRNSGGADQFRYQDVGSPPVQALALYTAEIAWGVRIDQNCDAFGVCNQRIELLRSEDGGYTWLEMATPDELQAGKPAGGRTRAVEFARLTGASRAQGVWNFIGQGIDKCEIPTSSQLQTWQESGPYGAVNLYIGGDCRSCSNKALSSEFLSQIDDQGWKFIPTWVGPQSSCFNGCGGSKINNDSAAAFQQGIQEADEALEAAIRLGLAAADGSGTIIYYDLEAYSSNSTTCRTAAQSFISGWSKRLRERGSKAGLYAATCGSILREFASIEHVPDAIWPAYWVLPYGYDSEASVWDLLCLDNGLWSNSQRIRQYAGGHSEYWGGVGLTVDSNVLDGLVAGQQAELPPSPAPSATATATSTAAASPTATATSTATQTAAATATKTAVCEQRLNNAGFESDGGWERSATAYPAIFSSERAHSGNRALRAGIIDLQDNVFSYSSATQVVTIPAGAQDQVLSFWLYTQSDESGAVRLPGRLQALEDVEAAETSDLQMVLIRDGSGVILERLFVERLDERAWREISFDISRYAGTTIQIYFGVYNNGTGGTTGMYVDDVSLGSCEQPEPTATATPAATPMATGTPPPGKPFRFFAPIMFRDYPFPIPPYPGP